MQYAIHLPGWPSGTSSAPLSYPTLASYSHSNTSTAPTLFKLSPSDQPKISPYGLWACARAHPRSPWGPANFPSLGRYACLVKLNCVGGGVETLMGAMPLYETTTVPGAWLHSFSTALLPMCTSLHLSCNVKM